MAKVIGTTLVLAVFLFSYDLSARADTVDETIWQPDFQNDPVSCHLEALFDADEPQKPVLPLDVAGFHLFSQEIEVPGFTYLRNHRYLVLRFSPEWNSDIQYSYPSSVSVNGQDTVQLKFEDDDLHSAFFVLSLPSTVDAFLGKTNARNLSLEIEYQDESNSELIVSLFDSKYFHPGLAMFEACIGAISSQHDSTSP